MAEIKLYVKTGDPYSDMVRNLLKYYELNPEIIEISSHPERKAEMEEISGQSGTPVLKVDDKVFCGFDREKIKEILGIE